MSLKQYLETQSQNLAASQRLAEFREFDECFDGTLFADAEWRAAAEVMSARHDELRKAVSD